MDSMVRSNGRKVTTLENKKKHILGSSDPSITTLDYSTVVNKTHQLKLIIQRLTLLLFSSKFIFNVIGL